MNAAQTPLIPDFTQNPKLLEKFGESGPYYTNYPTHGNWSGQLNHSDYVESLQDFFLRNPREPIHVYVHIPFCAKLCYYCICNIRITNDRDKMQHFVDHLCAEIDLLKRLFSDISIKPNVKEIHLGGGTPSHLENSQVRQLINKLGELADLKGLYEFAMEIDPRTANKENIKYYCELGVNRISFGVQDFDPDVQDAINRIQPVELVEALLPSDIRAHFDGLNFDLLYGLPRQTRKTFQKTLELVKRISPERITLLKYAHAPEVRKHMKLIKKEELPPAAELPHMFYDAVQTLTSAGYVWVGIDHFAKPSDDLAQAAKERRVWRNFGGFTTGRTHNLIGIGPTATSAVGNTYYQNTYELKEYSASIEKGVFPIHRGYRGDSDDALRREIIFRILCDSALDYQQIERKFGISFTQYFSHELATLAALKQNGIIEFGDKSFSLTPVGRFFGRHVARAFDRFLQKSGGVYKLTGP